MVTWLDWENLWNSLTSENSHRCLWTRRTIPHCVKQLFTTITEYLATYLTKQAVSLSTAVQAVVTVTHYCTCLLGMAMQSVWGCCCATVLTSVSETGMEGCQSSWAPKEFSDFCEVRVSWHCVIINPVCTFSCSLVLLPVILLAIGVSWLFHFITFRDY